MQDTKAKEYLKLCSALFLKRKLTFSKKMPYLVLLGIVKKFVCSQMKEALSHD